MLFIKTHRIAARTKVLLVAGLILILLSHTSCKYVIFFVMSRETVRTHEKKNIQGYSVKLKSRQGWAGPPGYYYVLKKRMLLGLVKIPIAKQNVRGDSLERCMISFDPNKRKTIVIDKCNDTSEKIKR